ncbi:MAG TPA: MoxR family ATPase [Candidatus Saccharimonadales bacterium]|nr:MoxR family ATPase [Candidatus Saccharimonadales bacterium]
MEAQEAYQKILAEMRKHISGDNAVIELMFIAILSEGHAILEGVPGIAKTTITKALADTIQADFRRIQGTPDIGPSDIVGYTYIDEKNETRVSKGPVFTNILLFDELNRAQPKVMSALLETLEEKQVTLGGLTMQLPKPFNAFATQNPLRIEGTEPLPKVLADRFIMRIPVDYPTREEEGMMLRLKEAEETITVNKIIGTEDILRMQQEAKKVTLGDEVKDYITGLVDATRKDIHIVMGASPRADIAFMRCGKAKAMIEGRSEVNRGDITFLARPVLSHRLSVRSTGGIGVNGIIDGIVATYT